MSIDRRPNGRYRVRWREADGTQRAKSFKRKHEAVQFEATVTVGLNDGTYVDPSAGKVTVGEYAKEWAAGQPWRDTSRRRIEHILDLHVIPRFGKIPLRSVRRSDVQGWVGKMSADGLAASTVESYFRVLAAIMRAARADRLISVSPTDGVRLPRPDGGSSALVPLTVDEVEALAAAFPDRYGAIVPVSAGLGLRQGEACGLTVDRVDFLRRTVTIDRQLVTPPKGECYLGPVKTASSNRVIPLPSSVADTLAAHIAANPPGEHGLIFTSNTGAPLRRTTYSDAFRRAARDTGIKATSHDLRHHAASLLISSGVSVKGVQQFLGHKNAAETLDVYSHLWPGDEDRIRDAIDSGRSAGSNLAVVGDA